MALWIMIGRYAALMFIGLGGFIAVMNWVMVIVAYRTGRFHSAIPLFGAVFLSVGLALLPQTRRYAWVAFLVDYGTLNLLYSLPNLVRQMWETSRYNLVAEYLGSRGIMTARLSLYNGGICVIKHDLKRVPGDMGMVGTSSVGMWSRDGQRLALQIGDTSAHFEVVVEGASESLRQVDGFSWQANAELSLADVEMQRQGTVR